MPREENTNIFVCALYCKRIGFIGGPFEVQWGSLPVAAKNKPEAMYAALEYVKQVYPETDGWFGHSVMVAMFSKKMLNDWGWYRQE